MFLHECVEAGLTSAIAHAGRLLPLNRIDDEEVRTEKLLWAVAVRRDDEGRFVVLAWRDLTNER